MTIGKIENGLERGFVKHRLNCRFITDPMCFTSSYTEFYLSADINECENDPCQNGATCVNSPGSYSCNCADGYTGDQCQEGKIGAYIQKIY